MTELDDRLERQARNEALFREVNERIAHLAEAAQTWSLDGRIEFMCECGVDGGCREMVRIPVAAYEQVRQQDDRFVVLPGHETPELERTVERTAEYVVVDKIAAAEWLVADDPRGAPST